MGLRSLPGGQRANSFPRISPEIDAERLEFLFDGAPGVLSPHALGARGGPRPATSFITRSVFEGWRPRHPARR